MTTTQIPKLALAAIYRQFFTLGLAGSDLSATKTSFKALLQNLEVNVAQVDNYIGAMQAYLSVVVEAPTSDQATTMTSQLDLFDVAEANFVESFEGLSDISSPFFVADPRNSDLNTRRVASSAAKTSLRNTPSDTFGFFDNPDTATAFADYNIAAIDVSNRIKSGV